MAAQAEAQLRASLEAEAQRPLPRSKSNRKVAALPSSPRPIPSEQQQQTISSAGTGDYGTQITSSSGRTHRSNTGLVTIAPGDIVPGLINSTAAATKMVWEAETQRWIKQADAQGNGSDEDIFKDFDASSAPADEGDRLDVPSTADRPRSRGSLLNALEAGPPEEAEHDESDDTESWAKDGEYTDERHSSSLHEEAPMQLYAAAQIVVTEEPDSPRSQRTPDFPASNSSLLPDAPALRLGNPLLTTPAVDRPPVRPRSALKSSSDPVISTPLPAGQSPSTDSAKRRSVSFSDRLQVPVRAVSEPPPSSRMGSNLRNEIQYDDTETTSESHGDTTEPSPLSSKAGGGSSAEMGDLSARSRRIEKALNDVAKLGLGPTPVAVIDEDSVFTANHSTKPRRSSFNDKSLSHPYRTGKADATFLTECSFGETDKKLVELITDVAPFDLGWERMQSIDMSGKAIISLAHLQEYLPALDEADLCVGNLRLRLTHTALAISSPSSLASRTVSERCVLATTRSRASLRSVNGPRSSD